MTQDTIITLIINQAGTPPQYLMDIKINGIVLVSHNFSADDTVSMQNISHQFSSYFECSPPLLSMEKQAVLGRELFSICLAPYWDKIKKSMTTNVRRILVIASPVSEVLNLPWEMVATPEGKFLGVDPLFSIRRLPKADDLPAYAGELRAPPLRLLFMACAPTDQATLDYELEEERLLEAVSGQDLAFDSGDLGTFQELCDRVISFKPHIVHISGHGVVKDGKGLFCFEDDAGLTDNKSSEEICAKLAGKDVQCIFVSGCQTGQSPAIEALGGICQGLVNNEIPLAVGWAASISDDLATQFAKSFYSNLASNLPVDPALTAARQDIWDICKKQGSLSWTLPMLYASTTQNLVVDPDLPIEEPPRTTMIQQPLPGMKEGYAEHFVGRRREQQRLIPALRDKKGGLRVLILSGMGGCGKSSLATRMARKLETEGFELIPIPSSESDPLNAGKIMDACSEAFLLAADRLRLMVKR